MGRFCHGFVTIMRVLQLLLSLAALACGVYITYEMFSMAASATDLQASLTSITPTTEDEAEALNILEQVLLPILHYFEETPVRAIILTAVVRSPSPAKWEVGLTNLKALWSICLIIYLMCAQRASAKANNSAKMNKRWIRVCLEVLTLLLWITGIICAALLAMEYGSIIFVGGPEMKVAWTAVKPLVKDAIERSVDTLTTDDGPLLRQLDIVDDIFTIGALSILAVVAAGICGLVSILSLLAACCISGKPQKKTTQLENGHRDQLVPMLQDRSEVTLSPNPSPLVVNVNGFPSPPTPGYAGYTSIRQPWEAA